MQVSEHQYVASKQKLWFRPKQLFLLFGLSALLQGMSPAYASSPEPSQGIAPFATSTHSYDSNLLNRSEEGSGPAPQSDQVNRTEIGTHVNFQLSRQKFSGALSVSDTKHERFKERNVDGNAYRLRWDAEIGKTLTGFVEGSSISDQAPIQTGLVSVIQRDQDNATAELSWNFHPSYSVLNQYSHSKTRFVGTENSNDAVLAGLNRDDESSAIGLQYKPSSGSSVTILFKQAEGNFPIRQVIGPGQSVSNNFNQDETELLTKWNYSEITTLTLSLSSVRRTHEELQSRDYSGTNYRLEILYSPTVKTNFNLSWAKQIVGISDATNSDALADQLFLSMNMEVTDKILFRLAYLPQNLQFAGTDTAGSAPRTERIREAIASIEYEFLDRLSLGANLRNRERGTTLENADYSANSMSIFLKYVH